VEILKLFRFRILILIVVLVGSSVLVVRPAHASWTTGEWSIEPSQTLQCYLVYPDGSQPNGWNWCEAIRLDVKADSQETNGAWDYYQLTLRNYDYNTSSSCANQQFCGFPLKDYSVYMTYNLVNGGSGTTSVQPQGGWIWCPQPTLTLSYGFLSVGLLAPCEQIDFWDNIGAAQDDSHWHVYQGLGISPLCNFYCEQGIDVSIPEGQGWTFTFHYRDETPKDYCNSPTNSQSLCYFDMTYSITVPAGHIDPATGSGGGGGCVHCYKT
jgi:hypothetical protein